MKLPFYCLFASQYPRIIIQSHATVAAFARSPTAVPVLTGTLCRSPRPWQACSLYPSRWSQCDRNTQPSCSNMLPTQNCLHRPAFLGYHSASNGVPIIINRWAMELVQKPPTLTAPKIASNSDTTALLLGVSFLREEGRHWIFAVKNTDSPTEIISK